MTKRLVIAGFAMLFAVAFAIAQDNAEKQPWAGVKEGSSIKVKTTVSSANKNNGKEEVTVQATTVVKVTDESV
jgi:uncharacterized protein YdeI (BOF family)